MGIERGHFRKGEKGCSFQKRPTKRPTQMKFKLLLPNPSRETNSVQIITFIDKKRVKIGTGVAGFHLPMSPALPHNYALLYVEGESTFQNLTIPLTGRRNSAGIFAGMNSDNLFLELAQ